MSAELIAITDALADAVDGLSFGAPVTHVYNPLRYARDPLVQYLERFGHGEGRALLLGMNPGPFGMAQTGVPFGDVELVRTFLKISAPVGAPPDEHPKRPVLGFALDRREVSGSRLWGWAQQRYGSAEAFFTHFLVVNYCPLVFMAESGRNVTPDKLPAPERDALFACCDAALVKTVELLRPSRIIGVGAFAASRARKALPGSTIPIARVLHPSPASPKANRGWAEAAEKELVALGLSLPPTHECSS